MKCAAIITIVTFASAAGAQPSSFRGIGDIPGEPFESAAYGVSNDGQVVVGYSIGSSNRVPIRWTAAGGLENLEPEPFGVWNWTAAAASADGSVIVGSSEAAWATRAFRWTGATGMVDLGDLPGGTIWATATSVSGDGSIVVGHSDNGAMPSIPYTAFRWTEAGGMQPLLTFPYFSWAYGISSDGSTVVGNYGAVAYRWTAVGAQVLGIEDAYAAATSGDGTIVVGRTSYYPPYFLGCGAVRWVIGAPYPECLTWGLGLANTSAGAISGDGSIILISNYAPGQETAMIWDADHGARVLRTVLESEYGIDLTGWQLGTASSVSANGTVIVGAGVNPCGQKEGWVAHLGTPACPPDCNTDGSLTIADFGCFQTRFVAQDPYGDCTRDCQFTIADFGCFQTAFVQGCP